MGLEAWRGLWLHAEDESKQNSHEVQGSLHWDLKSLQHVTSHFEVKFKMSKYIG